MDRSPDSAESRDGASAAPRRFGVVVPVKPPSVAKSRLSALGDDVRRELVTAFVADTVSAALDCSRVGAVLVVTDDVALARSLDDLGVPAIPDGHPGVLNEALRQGAAELVRRHPTLAPVALCADLPCLRTGDLDAVLGALPETGPAFVADAATVGTTLYAAPEWASFEPQFGPASRAAHLAGGATEIAAAPSVRRDVDTPEDLAEAQRIGLGPRTSFTVTRYGLAQ